MNHGPVVLRPTLELGVVDELSPVTWAHTGGCRSPIPSWLNLLTSR